jgi:transcription initiation factor TFIIIB Brf1 subunit/transcription initiation factor TFIIB
MDYNCDGQKKISLITTILDKLPFGSNIKNTAQSHFNNLSIGLHKSNKRMQLAFFCILKALHEHEIYTDPVYICKFLGLSKQAMHASMSLAETDDKIVIRNPKDYINYYLNIINTKYNIIIDENRISEIIQRVLKNNPVSINMTPQSICYACVFYYIQLNNYNIPKDEFASICYVSPTCLKKMVTFVSQADNL